MARTFRLLPLLGVALLSIAALAPRQAAAQEDDATPRLSVRGQGTVGVRPDVAVVTMGAAVRRPSAGEAFVQANTLIAALNQVLRENGIPERDVQTRQFSLSPEFGRQQGDAPAPIVAWRAVNLVSVRMRDFGGIGTVIDEAARVLGNDAQISGISFTVEDTDAIARQARDQAIANARERAAQIAAAAGVRLVRILSITETSAPPPTPVARAAAPAPAGVAAAQAAEVTPGEQNLSVTVEIVYEIE